MQVARVFIHCSHTHAYIIHGSHSRLHVPTYCTYLHICRHLGDRYGQHGSAMHDTSETRKRRRRNQIKHKMFWHGKYCARSIQSQSRSQTRIQANGLHSYTRACARTSWNLWPYTETVNGKHFFGTRNRLCFFVAAAVAAVAVQRAYRCFDDRTSVCCVRTSVWESHTYAMCSSHRIHNRIGHTKCTHTHRYLYLNAKKTFICKLNDFSCWETVLKVARAYFDSRNENHLCCYRNETRRNGQIEVNRRIASFIFLHLNRPRAHARAHDTFRLSGKL